MTGWRHIPLGPEDRAILDAARSSLLLGIGENWRAMGAFNGPLFADADVQRLVALGLLRHVERPDVEKPASAGGEASHGITITGNGLARLKLSELRARRADDLRALASNLKGA